MHPQLGTTDSMFRSAFPLFLMVIARTRVLSCGCLPKSIRLSGATSFGKRASLAVGVVAAVALGFAGVVSAGPAAGVGGGIDCTASGVGLCVASAVPPWATGGWAELLLACSVALVAEEPELSAGREHAGSSATSASRAAHGFLIGCFMRHKFSMKEPEVCNAAMGDNSASLQPLLRLVLPDCLSGP